MQLLPCNDTSLNGDSKSVSLYFLTTNFATRSQNHSTTKISQTWAHSPQQFTYLHQHAFNPIKFMFISSTLRSRFCISNHFPITNQWKTPIPGNQFIHGYVDTHTHIREHMRHSEARSTQIKMIVHSRNSLGNKWRCKQDGYPPLVISCKNKSLMSH